MQLPSPFFLWLKVPKVPKLLILILVGALFISHEMTSQEEENGNILLNLERSLQGYLKTVILLCSAFDSSQKELHVAMVLSPLSPN